jgi:hypothetical protein
MGMSTRLAFAPQRPCSLRAVWRYVHPENGRRVALSIREKNNDRLEYVSIRWLSNDRLSTTESMTGMSTINSH